MMRPIAPVLRGNPPKPELWQFFKQPLTDARIAGFEGRKATYQKIRR
jgi:hypothetical protein